MKRVMKMMERWIEVDLNKLAHNFQLIRQALPAEVKLLAVVKADAYGHGLVPVGRLFAQLGADMLGVTDIAEGEALRQAGVTVPILVFAPFLRLISRQRFLISRSCGRWLSRISLSTAISNWRQAWGGQASSRAKSCGRLSACSLLPRRSQCRAYIPILPLLCGQMTAMSRSS